MDQLNKNRSLVLLGLAVLFLVLFAVYMYLVKPTASDLDDQETKIAQLSQERSLLQRKLKEKQEQSASYSDEAVQRALPLWDNTEQLMLDIGTIEGRTGAETLSATFNAADDQDLEGIIQSSESGASGGEAAKDTLPAGIKKLKAATVVQGTYEQVLAYVDTLQKLDRLITIESLDIAKSGDAEAAGAKIKANLMFTAYFDPAYRSQVKEVLEPFEN